MRELEPTAERMDMGVYEARRDQAPVGVDRLGPRRVEALDITDPDDAPVTDGDPTRFRIIGAGENDSVADDQICLHMRRG